MSEIVKLQEDTTRDAIHRGVQLLADGQLIGLPTETGYVAAASCQSDSAVGTLKQLANGELLTLAIRQGDEALDFVPGMSSLGQKLLRRCWPGPVTLDYGIGDAGALGSVTDTVREAIVDNQRLQFRVPQDIVASECLRLSANPLVFSAEAVESERVVTADGLQAAFGDSVSMILDSGETRYDSGSTIVSIREDAWRIEREGVVTQGMMNRLASTIFLFVCTGNTCRSPMAEGLFRKFLCDRLQCTDDELVDRGYVVLSAGIAAAHGAPARSETLDILSERGIDLANHSSQPVTQQLLNQADHIYTMTRHHRDAILLGRPDVADRMKLLSQDGAEIPDPIGGGMGEYKRCEAEMECHLQSIVAECD